MNLKKLILIIVWSAAILGWSAVVGIYFTDPTTREWAIVVTVAAILTEVAFWTTAAMLGLTLLESRKRVWQWFKRPFSQS